MANYPHPAKGTRHNPNSGFKSGVRRQLREDRQIQAKIRQELYDKLTPAQKLAQLDAAKLTAKRERARLNKQLAEAVAAKSAGRPSIADQLKAKK